MPEYYLNQNHTFNSDTQEIIPGGRISKERNIVLELLVANPGIHGYKEIDRLLHQKTGFGISKNALEVLINRLRDNLPDEIRSQLTTTWKRGYEWKIGE